LWCASDHANNMKQIIKYLIDSNSYEGSTIKVINVDSNFHLKRRNKEMNYTNKEIRYWSESDIGHILKGNLGRKNRIFNIKTLINILRGQGIEVWYVNRGNVRMSDL
jgi:hypothetical protein